ncbi:MAG: copper resistance protein CopC [Micromonosporaceae bacterium]
MRGFRFRLAMPARVIGAVLAAVLVALTPVRPAWAHAQLIGTDPADGAVLATPPERVTLEFNESLNPTYTTIVVTDASAERVPSSEPEVSGPRGSVTFTQPLTDGTYTVAYRVVSRDGHPVQGAFTFTVGEPAPSSATPPATTAPSGPAHAEGEAPTGQAGGGTVVLAALGALALLVAGGAWLWARRRAGQR